METKDRNKIYYRLLLIAAIIIPVVIGFSYAYFLAVVNITNDQPTVIQGTVVSNINFELQTENNGYINASEIIPLTQEQIEDYAEVGTFKVVTGTNPYVISYNLSLTNISISAELKNQYFKWRLICTSCASDDISKNAEGNFANVTGTDMTLKNNILIPSNSNDEYKLMIWLEESNSDQTNTINKTFTAKVKAEAELINQGITVTFDANGGTTALASKVVAYGQPYNTLPTPTREGYTFKGWNGRNYYNASDTVNVQNGITKDSNDWIIVNTSTGARYYSYFTHNLDIIENTTYTIVTEIGNISNLTGPFFVTSQNDLSTQFNTLIYDNNQLTNMENTINIYNMTSKDNVSLDVGIRTFYYNVYHDTKGILTFRISVLDVDNSLTENNFEYEPYYITSSTNVVQNTNHTLKAIWEANS